MKFNLNSLYYTDGYKIGHKKMLAPNTTRLYGTWIPRSLKHAPKGISKIMSVGQQFVWKWLHDEFEENFFKKPESCVDDFIVDMTAYLGLEYDGEHFRKLHKLGYLPIEVQALPEGIETNPNIPHMTFINTVDGFGWLTLYLETIVSSLAWKIATSATIAKQYKNNVKKWVAKTDPSQDFLIPFMCHDFSARGLSPFDMYSSGLGHAMSFRGSDTLSVMQAARYFYNEKDVAINSVNASEHSVSTTKIFTVGEKQMLLDWIKDFPNGILSVVSDTFDLWKLITEYLPEIKDEILDRDGKLVIRPDSGDPVDIICGLNNTKEEFSGDELRHPSYKGVVELLWDIFGGTVNEQGYKVLDSHIGCIYGDSITLERQIQIYERLEAKGFATTNIVLGVGSFTFQYNTRDSFGYAAKGAWFEVENDKYGEYMDQGLNKERIGYSIYKDPITDDGTKKSLKGFQFVYKDIDDGEYKVLSEVSEEEAYSYRNELKTIYRNGNFFNQVSLTEIRERIDKI